MTEYDVIIVGARIAGALTAALLGERGWHVLLLDRATFPSDTLSTHFFRSSALLAFQRAGVFDEVQAVGAPHLVDLFNDVDGHIFTEPVEGSDGYNGRGIEQGSTHAVLLADALHRWL
ncbi:MAG: FAD-dependent monooxygenase, partial [Armatimonadetes bacterium]|nr:FAD-dependent monooxygenase [Armatimonadota bacterium]